ncbi:Septin-9 [Bagarius yarrelli]|uniref:Septin-9 n=1 Tax=Bagarius yarrelli TaxID=175774 RepID=A0A556VC01_BAGYA|nr:Septin-9 [Bagarius yarrelli]
MVSSLSFNRGTMGKPTITANTGINRASSFQNKFNPNGFNSSSGPGSDNDSLHSSSSSLEYQASSKISSYTSPPQSPMGVGEYKSQRLGSPALKKFSSHGNMFHSELEGPLVIPTEPLGISHGSMPSLDLQMAEGGGPRRVVSHGTRYPGSAVTWNAYRLQNNGNLGKDLSINHQAPKTKEPARLNKFPLDLDNLVAKTQTASPVPPKPPIRFHPVSTSPTISESTSASVSSLDSADLPMVHTSTMEKRELDTPPGAIQVPNICESPVLLSPAQTPHFNLVSQPQMVQLAPAKSPLPTRVNIISSPAQNEPQAKDSVGSILQRIASFSKVDVKAEKPHAGFGTPLSNGLKRESLPIRCKELKRSEETVQELDLEPEQPVRMEEEREVELQLQEEHEVKKESPFLIEPNSQGVIRGGDLFGYVGIEAVLDQMRRKTMKSAFEFNIMVVVIEEKGVKMRLTVIDTPGFGDQINNENCWEPIVTYINEQYEKYLKEELHVNRKRRIPDTRVHCCVYFLPATGHRLRPIDVEFMKRLGKIVSIVPVIAKADTLTMDERLEFKQRIRQDLQTHGIRVYPQKEYDEDAEDRILNDKIRVREPSNHLENVMWSQCSNQGLIYSYKEHQVNGNKVLGRKTKWGIIEVENVEHCEFANLRDLLIRSHLQDLKDVTHYIHYETYRVQRLNESNASGLGLSIAALENEQIPKLPYIQMKVKEEKLIFDILLYTIIPDSRSRKQTLASQ